MKLLHTLIISLLLLSSCSEAARPVAKPFEYRALCTPTNANPKEFDLDSTNNVDYDWSLWGHNLWKVVGKDAPDEVYAIVNGQRDRSQFCFSSQRLYTILDEWIIDQWGTKGGRFTIMPADNKKVCQCERCKAAGNTEQSATPAVAALMTRLAKKYPDHQFFLTAYHTTKTPPTAQMPKNAGVMLSTMDIPMRFVFEQSGGYHKFDMMVKAWKKVTPLLYVWEYDRNFDDYLTPYPCLMIMQQRLRYYQSVGITGVFINGSGDDYSTFDDVQSYVLSRLLLNVDEDVEKLVREFYDRFYPVCGRFIADYYLSLEKDLRRSNHVMPYYGTMAETTASYLDPQAFTDFWISLDKKSKSVEGTERQLINQMLTAMAYTRLQLRPTEDERAELILILKEYKSVPRLLNYKETKGSLEDYLKKYQKGE